MKPLVFDATPLIYLGKINIIEKINGLPEDKYTTKSVCIEVVEVGKNIGRQEAFVIEKLIKSKIIKLRIPANKQYISTLRQNPKIHKADADVLALAVELDGIALLDDEEARGIAEIEGIEHHGTIFLLLRMMKMKLLTKEEVVVSLNEMIYVGWRCSTELYAEIIKALNK
jgi:predicted nucleic acid-binding protein